MVSSMPAVMRILAVLALYMQPAFSLVIMVPLYAYPGGDGLTAWNSVLQIIKAHPKVEYLVIVNPDSGPGSTQYPDTNYIRGLSRLNKLSNVDLVGYVDTWFTSVPLHTVQANIDKYAGWASYTASNISLNGIFFDDMTSDANQTAYNYMHSVASYARSSFANRQKSTVVFNPGCKVDATYFQWADYIIEFEDSLSNYKGLGSVERKKVPMREKQAIVAHDANPSAAEMQQLLAAMYKQQIGSVYMTKECCYNGIASGQLTQMSNMIAKLQRGN